MTKDFNPRRYKAKSNWNTPFLPREFDAEVERRFGRQLESLRRANEVCQAEQHRYRIAFMLFCESVKPDEVWQEIWVEWLMRASEHIEGDK